MTKILASKPNKISAKTSTSENLRFTKPSLSKLSNVIQELELSSDQVHELSLVMQHIEADLDFAIGVIEKLPPRSTLTRRLKNLEKNKGLSQITLKRCYRGDSAQEPSEPL